VPKYLTERTKGGKINFVYNFRDFSLSGQGGTVEKIMVERKQRNGVEGAREKILPRVCPNLPMSSS
jgi:hypothetical protein